MVAWLHMENADIFFVPHQHLTITLFGLTKQQDFTDVISFDPLSGISNLWIGRDLTRLRDHCHTFRVDDDGSFGWFVLLGFCVGGLIGLVRHILRARKKWRWMFVFAEFLWVFLLGISNFTAIIGLNHERRWPFPLRLWPHLPEYFRSYPMQRSIHLSLIGPFIGPPFHYENSWESKCAFWCPTAVVTKEFMPSLICLQRASYWLPSLWKVQWSRFRCTCQALSWSQVWMVRKRVAFDHLSYFSSFSEIHKSLRNSCIFWWWYFEESQDNPSMAACFELNNKDFFKKWNLTHDRTFYKPDIKEAKAQFSNNLHTSSFRQAWPPWQIPSPS